MRSSSMDRVQAKVSNKQSEPIWVSNTQARGIKLFSRKQAGVSNRQTTKEWQSKLVKNDRTGQDTYKDHSALVHFMGDD